MKYLHLNDVDFNKYDRFGFDMDGTLYDEITFIKQAYRRIAAYFSLDSSVDVDRIYNDMIEKWIVKGSSYPFIFEETLRTFNIHNKTIEHALHIYRSTEPQLTLLKKIKNLLEALPRSKCFLITDGYASLQRNKYTALGLARYFAPNNCCFTGDLGRNHYKPSSLSLSTIKSIESSSRLIYFGDRHIDEQFCINTGMDFVYVDNFKEFWGDGI